MIIELLQHKTTFIFNNMIILFNIEGNLYISNYLIRFLLSYQNFISKLQDSYQ